MTKEKLIIFFNKNNKFFHEDIFNKFIDYAIEKEPRTKELLNEIYNKFANKPNTLLLPYAVVNMVYFEFFPKIGESYMKHLKVKKFIGRHK